MKINTAAQDTIDECITAWDRALKASNGSSVRHVLQPMRLPAGQVAVVETTRNETVLLTLQDGEVVAHECGDYYTATVAGPDRGLVWSGHVAEPAKGHSWGTLLDLVAPDAPVGTRVDLDPARNPLPNGGGWSWEKTDAGWV